MRAGIRVFGFHALRHARASIMDMNNVPIGAIQRVLGHENRTMTEISSTISVMRRGRQLMFMNRPGKKITHKVTHKQKSTYSENQ